MKRGTVQAIVAENAQIFLIHALGLAMLRVQVLVLIVMVNM